ncbi:MAG: hypothetical protein HYX72_06160 [Acidobacteria bacterium]|nr:hypothetical protein [Acidobacteriota bacterium]
MEPGTSEGTALTARLERLEKQNRRMKQIGALALIVIGSVLLMGHASSKRTVEANEFKLKDSSGKVRAILDEDSLSWLDTNQKTRLMLGVWGAGPRILLLDESEKTRAELWATASGTHLDLFDANRQARAFIGTTDAKGTPPVLNPPATTYAPSAILLGTDGKIVWKAP